jgi:hypothetical protein
VRGIALEEPVCVFGFPLNVEGQLGKKTPELPSCS